MLSSSSCYLLPIKEQDETEKAQLAILLLFLVKIINLAVLRFCVCVRFVCVVVA